jgi:hypothetical protein
MEKGTGECESSKKKLATVQEVERGVFTIKPVALIIIDRRNSGSSSLRLSILSSNGSNIDSPTSLLLSDPPKERP